MNMHDLYFAILGDRLGARLGARLGVYPGTRLLSCQLGRAACCGLIEGIVVQLC